jgi:hypothetical protein
MEISRLLELNKYIQSFQALKLGMESQPGTEVLTDLGQSLDPKAKLLELLLQKLSPTESSILKLHLHEGLVQADQNSEAIKINLLKTVLNLLEQDNTTDSEVENLIKILSKAIISPKTLSAAMETLEPAKKQLLEQLIQKIALKDGQEAATPSLKEIEVILKKEHNSIPFSRLLAATEQLKNTEILHEADKPLLALVNRIIHSQSDKSKLDLKSLSNLETLQKDSTQSEMLLELKELIINNPKLIQQLKDIEDLSKFSPYKNINSEIKAELITALLKFSLSLKSESVFEISRKLANTSDSSAKSIMEILLPLSFITQESNTADNIEKLSKFLKTLKPSHASRTSETNQTISQRETDSNQQIQNKNNVSSTDKLAQEMLSKLSQVAEKHGEQSYQQIFIPFISTPIEIKFGSQNTREIEQEGSKDKNAADDKSETIECCLTLPKLGQIGIKISIFKNNVSIALSSERSSSCTLISEINSDLSTRIISKGFEKPIISVANKEVPQVKPEWLLNLIQLKTVG